MTTPTIYVQRDHAVGYGPRIFVPYEHVAALKWILDPLSTWQGSDKDTGKAKGWEFPTSEPKRLSVAIIQAADAGFKTIPLDASNAHEVWP
jgi:hypothetical protein